MNPRTMYRKIWESHLVREAPGEPSLIYIDRHLIHEVTSPQAFAGLKAAGRTVRRPDLTFAVMDHSVPTKDRNLPILDAAAGGQFDALERSCRESGITLFDMFSHNQGIVHVIGPELGLTQPGQTIVCGDSHTSTHGAFGTLAFGIGTSEVEHVLATQCMPQYESKTMHIVVNGKRAKGVSAKDIILAIIGKIGIAGGTGHVVEYAGEAIRALSMDGRMTVCNMSIEGGARAGMIAPDDTTFAYLEGRPYVPRGKEFQEAVEAWKALATDPGAKFDATVELDASALAPQVTWGTNPGMVTGVTGRVPDPGSFRDPDDQKGGRACAGLHGSQTRHGARGRSRGPRVHRILHQFAHKRSARRRLAWLPASTFPRISREPSSCPARCPSKRRRKPKGLDKIFRDAGFEWRDAGCSMCIAMNPDVLLPGERAASTSNRNFEGRQGKDSRTHLVSPIMAAAAAIAGHFVDVRDWNVEAQE